MAELSPLVRIKLERDAWKEVEKMSRAYKDKPLHAEAVKKSKELGETLVRVAHDEMESGDSDVDKGKLEGEDEVYL